MIDPVSLTELVLAAGAVAATWGVPFVLVRRRNGGDGLASNTVLTSWAELNDALKGEIRRLHTELDHERADRKRQLGAATADYQRQLDSAYGRITELEQEVAALHRALRGGT